MTDQRWSAETRELVERVFDYVEFDLTDEVLTALADAGLLLPPGGGTCTSCGVPLASHQCTYCHDDPPRGHNCPRCARPAGHVGWWRPADTEETKP